jgi:hypothetical protein
MLGFDAISALPISSAPDAEQAAASAAFEDSWGWAEDSDGFCHELGDFGLESGPVIANGQAPVDAILDSFVAEDEYEDPTTDLVEASSGPVQANAPPLDGVQDDPWPWATDDDVADDWQQDAYSLDADPIADDAWPWSIEDDAADLWPLDDVLVDNTIAIDSAFQADPDQDDIPDDAVDESAPVGTDAAAPVEAAQPDFWLEEDAPDDFQDESAPVIADVVALEQPPASDWLDEDAQDDPPDEPALVGTDAAQDQPPVDAWWWDEEPADDDFWWQTIDCPLVDLVLLPGLPYGEDWGWNGEDTEDDSHWFEIPEPDPAGLPADTCPAQLAAAMAQIADLQAQLAAALANAGGGGGGAGGDGDDNITSRREIDEQAAIFERRRAEKRARIAQQNALIMALVGATVHGLKGPKEPK